ncbi:MAG: GAF domain-containing SpoIIE family protein phosphatase [Candidatus Eisenbacteria bacterium]
MRDKLLNGVVIALFVIVLAWSGVYLARDYTKVETFVGMGDIWSFLILPPDAPAIFTEVATEDFTAFPYPAVGDSLLEVDGLPANAENYFSVFNPTTPAGKVIPVKFRHGGRDYESTVVTRSIPGPLRVQVVSLFVLRTLITVTLVVLGFGAFLRRPSSSAVRVLALFCFATAVGMMQTLNVVAENYARFDIPYQQGITAAFFLFSLFGPVFFWKLQVVFPKTLGFYRRHRTRWNLLFFTPGVLYCAMAVTAGQNRIFLFDAIHRTLFLGLAFGFLVWQAFRSENFLARRQTRLVLQGSAPGLLLNLLLAWMVAFANPWFQAWSTLAKLYFFNAIIFTLLLIPVSFAYAFGRYRLLEVQAKVRRGTRLVAVNGAFLVVVFGILYTFGQLLLKYFNVESRTPTLVVGFMLAMGFVPAQRRVRVLLEERFYPERVRLRRLLRGFLQSAERTSDARTFWSGLSERLSAGLAACEVRPILPGGSPDLDDEGNGHDPYESFRSLVGSLESGGGPLLVDELIASDRVVLNEEQRRWFGATRAAVLLPLATQTGPVGFLLLGQKTNDEDYTPEELDLLRSLAAQIALVAENLGLLEERLEKQKLEEQLDVARRIQEGLLPRKLPETPGLEMAAKIRFCLDVAGDYYDVLPLPDGRTLIAIGDVAGKGVGAALLMSNLQASLRTVKDVGISLHEVVRRVNALIYDNTPSDLFITFFVAMADPKRKKLTYVNAGHNFPVLARADGGTERLGEGGLLLGVLPGSVYREETVKFGEGDTLLLFTDGVSEARRGDEDDFGEERIACLAQTHRKEPLDKLLEIVEREVEEFTGARTFEDDFTLLAVRVSAKATRAL